MGRSRWPWLGHTADCAPHERMEPLMLCRLILQDSLRNWLHRVPQEMPLLPVTVLPLPLKEATSNSSRLNNLSTARLPVSSSSTGRLKGKLVRI